MLLDQSPVAFSWLRMTPILTMALGRSLLTDLVVVLTPSICLNEWDRLGTRVELKQPYYCGAFNFAQTAIKSVNGSRAFLSLRGTLGSTTWTSAPEIQIMECLMMLYFICYWGDITFDKEPKSLSSKRICITVAGSKWGHALSLIATKSPNWKNLSPCPISKDKVTEES